MRELSKTAASPLEFRPRTVIVASLLAAAVIATAGSLSDVCVGDENSHARQASVYAQYGWRVPCDPIWESETHYSYAFWATPLWHAGLAALWKVGGQESQVLAQSYQAMFYLVLVLSVYFATRRIWDESAASWAWLLIATMPMACAYSILLLQDVPGIAVSALGMLLLWRRNFFGAGCCFAAAYLVKVNMLSFAPWAVVFAAWWVGGDWKQRLRATLLVAVPVVLAFGYDAVWRWTSYGSPWRLGKFQEFAGFSSNLMAACQGFGYDKVTMPHYNPIYSLKGIVTNFGVLVPLGIMAAVVRAWDKASRWLWLCVLLAGVGYIYMFLWPRYFGWALARYLFPVIFVLVLLGGRALSRWRIPSWLKVLAVGGAVAQAAIPCVYVYQNRQIPEVDKAAYAWIRENTPPRAIFLCSEKLLLTQQTGRPSLWNTGTAYFVSEATDVERREFLEYFHVAYVAIGLRRMYDPKKEERFAGGYPVDFVRHARTLPYLEKVYENDGFLIFKFNPHLTFNSWRKIPLAEFHPRVALTETEGDDAPGEGAAPADRCD